MHKALANIMQNRNYNNKSLVKYIKYIFKYES